MQKDYTFNNNSNIVILYDTNAEDAINDYKITFKIAVNLINILTGKKNYFVSLKEKDYTTNGIIIKLELKADKEVIELSICSSYIRIKHKNISMEFIINWTKDRYYASLVRYIEYFKDKIISQTYENSNNIYIEIFIKDKCFRIELPYHISYTLDNNIFSNLNENSSISYLKKIYLNRFFKGQNEYERKFGTNLYIYQINNDDKILLDKLTLENGIIKLYKLSNIKDNVLLSIEGTTIFDGKITIENYTMGSDLDLNSLISSLNKRVRKININ